MEKITYYNQGLDAEEKKQYVKAIDFYLLATLEEKESLINIYTHLAFVLHQKKFYEASCDAFLLKENNIFLIDKNSKEEEKKNQIILHEYLLLNQPLNVNDWLAFTQKAEALKCWNVVAYAYKEFLLRSEKFDFLFYKKMAYAYLQDNKYKEASFALEEEKYRNSLEFFPLEERIILYEGDDTEENIKKLYALYEGLQQDAYFDSRYHIWVGEKKDIAVLGESNTIFISKNTDLYTAYLARAKYLIATQSFREDFKRKAQQVFLLIGEENISQEASHVIDSKTFVNEIIQEVFFANKKIAFELKSKDKNLTKLYALAIDEFNNELWESSHKKFLEVKKKLKDVVSEFPTLYYIKESKAQLTMLNENKSMEELLHYQHYRFSAENFVGIDYLLKQAVKNASASSMAQWKEMQQSFLKILEDIKRNKTKTIRSIADKEFLTKVDDFSNCFDEKVESKLLPYQVWFVFANLFIFARLYEKYQLAREKALESILSLEKTSDTNLLRYKLNALAEKRDTLNYEKLRDELSLNSSEQIRKEFQLIGSLECCFNRHGKAVDFYKPFYSEDEKIFSKYIENKTIAIVGPVDSQLNLGEEIDMHDVVLRFNHKRVEESLKQSRGSKTNISFYISEVLVKDKIDTSKIESMNELDWIIFDKAHQKESMCFMGMTQNLRAGYFTADPFSNPYLKGTPSGIQRAILDLLRFNVGKIKVYNTNLFLVNNYDENYKSRGALGADHFNFIWHDPLSNFMFLKRLEEHNIIEADEVLSKILELTASEYIEALENRYGRKNDDTK